MRKQRAFASLTEDEINQIAEWLQQDTYDRVRERVAKPRPEGFGLQVKSRRPFETLFANKNRIDKINRKLETGQKLTLAEFESIAAGEKTDLPEQIHNAILETTYERVLEDDNTPTQLLALQRLADFPARAEYREHKIEMDLHRKEMAEHRKHISEERLELSRRLAKVREDELALKKTRALTPVPAPPPEEDELGPIATTPEGIRARAIALHGFDARELTRLAQERAKAASLRSEKTPLINTGIDAGASTPTLSPASVSTLSDTQGQEPTIHRSNNPIIQTYEIYETNNDQKRTAETP